MVKKQALVHGGMFSSIKNLSKLQNLVKAICKNKPDYRQHIGAMREFGIFKWLMQYFLPLLLRPAALWMPHLWFIKWKSIAFTFDFLTTKVHPLSPFKASVHRTFSERENHTLPSIPFRVTAKLSFCFSWYFVLGDLLFWKTSKGFMKWNLLFDPIPYRVWKALNNSVRFILYKGNC